MSGSLEDSLLVQEQQKVPLVFLEEEGYKGCAENMDGVKEKQSWYCCSCPLGQPHASALDEGRFAAGITANAIFISDVPLMEKYLTCIYSISLTILQQMRGKEDRADQWGRVERTCTSVKTEM